MIPKYLSAIWTAIPPALGNHLWQSTLCLAAAGLLTLALRKNRAEVRYGLWLAASVKFLIPFSLLVAVGMHLAPPKPQPRTTAGGLYFVMEEVSRPFSQAAPGSQGATESPRPWDAGLRYQLVRALPAGIAGLWLCGFLAVLGLWCIRWRSMTKVLRGASPLRQGREVEALRRAERLAGIRRTIELILSPGSLEPGIFGIIKPALVWPRGISERLEDEQLEAILAHELWHVRRWDNLAAAIHMVVEALFWFHPLVWWLGARLVEERERACDEAVLRLGNQREVYAESILKTCEFCLESPLACVSGVTGADLKGRIVRIMTQHLSNRLSLGRKILLAASGVAILGGPVVFGLLNVPQVRAQASQKTGAPLAASFEVASVKPNHSADTTITIMFQQGRFTATGIPVKQLITMAYNVKDFQVTGGPGWLDSEKYDIEAKVPDTEVDEIEKLPPAQRGEVRRSMLQSLLAGRFQLKLSHQTKELPVYALVVAKNGPKLHEAIPGDTYPNGIKGLDGKGQAGMMNMGPGELTGQGLPIASVAHLLSQRLGRNVLDQTELKGNYDFTLKWAPDQTPAAMAMGPDAAKTGTDTAPPPEASGPSIFSAIQEQLGLKLVSQKGPVEVLVIDHVERPSKN